MTKTATPVKRTRYYIVTDKSDGSEALVHAASDVAAKAALAGDRYTARIPTQVELVELMTTKQIKPIDATGKAAPKVDAPETPAAK